MDESGGVSATVRSLQGGIVFLLVFTDEGFDGDELEGGVIVIKEQGLPEASDSSVSVLKWMDEFQFVMKNAGADERVVVVGAKKLEEIVHEMGDAIRLWGDMADFRAFEDADVAGSPFSWVWYELIHHGLMGLKKGFR